MAYVMYCGYQTCDSPGNLQITDATVADLCHTLKTPWGDLATVWMHGVPSGNLT